MQIYAYIHNTILGDEYIFSYEWKTKWTDKVLEQNIIYEHTFCSFIKA